MRAFVDDYTVGEAYENFIKMFYPNRSTIIGVGLHFWAFVGVPKSSDISPLKSGWEIPENAAHCIRMLAGPHYKTIAKVMLAKGHQYTVPI